MRVVVMGLLALVAVGLGQLIAPYVPKSIAETVDASSADRLLQLIASAMLAVTIFSITVMVSVYQSSSSQWTPRVHRLIMQDRVTQNTMAVFIGAYVYALLGIILQELGVYDDERAFVVFWMTVLVLAVIVIYLIRWVLHLQGFGQLVDTSRQIEEVTRAQFKERLSQPCLGGRPFTGDFPDSAKPVPAWESGYIRQIYPEALNSVAEQYDMRVYLTRSVGSFVSVGESLMSVESTGDDLDWDAMIADVKETVILGDLREYDQDPRFGLIVMSEIGSKALSPGVNDPGTAIDVINRIGRILSYYKDETETEPETLLAHLHVAPIDPVDLLQDGFGAISRNGADTLEVQQRLQQTLSGLMRHPDKGLSRAARDLAKQELARGLAALTFEPDRDALIASADADVRPK